jgi:hypothetical protein
MRRIIPVFLLVAILAIGGGFIATTAYQAGLDSAVTTAVSSGSTVTPVVIPAYGYGYGYSWHPFGFGGLFGLLVGLFFLFIAFKVIGAIFFGGRRGWRSGGWGGPGGTGGTGHHGHGSERSQWMDRFGREGFDDWHRRAHAPASADEPPTSSQASNPT